MNPSAPPLPDDLVAVLKRMRLPYLRAAAPQVLATAKAQRWDPTEVLKVLLDEQVRGRDEATKAMRRKTAGLPAGKRFPRGARRIRRSRLRPSRPWPRWNGCSVPRTWLLASIFRAA